MNIKFLVFLCSLQSTSHILSCSDASRITGAIYENTREMSSGLKTLRDEQKTLLQAQTSTEAAWSGAILAELKEIKVELQETRKIQAEMLAFLNAWVPHISKQLEKE